MVISEKQLKANKKNAKKGGVKTEEGKSRSSLNAMKHGLLLSSQLALPGEEVNVLGELTIHLRYELRPSGLLELIIVDRIISCIWRLRRAQGAESTQIRDKYDKHFKEEPSLLSYWQRLAISSYISGSSVDTLLRYETTIERQLYKALDKLIEIRKLHDNVAVAGMPLFELIPDEDMP